MKLSIIIPVFNECRTVKALLERVKRIDIEKEIIVVDDGSTDGTREILKNEIDCKVAYHDKNQGKGAAIRTALKYITGDVVLIQDADLEYDPKDYTSLITPIIEHNADVVYSTRVSGSMARRIHFFWYYIGNRILTFLTNFLYNATLTDMECGYKVFKADIIKSLKLRSNRFDFEPEVTAKILKKRYILYEVPISYYGRNKEEGKKITWVDGLCAIWTLVKYKFID